MQPEEVFKRYDIRGKYPEEVNEKFAESLGKALGTFARRNYSPNVVIGKDNKESSSQLKKSFVKGLKQVGVNVLDVGTGPTDYTAFAGAKNGYISVQVTSSHLPLDTNGFKFMYPEGNGFLNPDLYDVQDLFREQDFEEGKGQYSKIDRDISVAYRKKIKEFFHQYFDSINKKIVVDTLGGATTNFLPGLLEDLGADIVNIAEEKAEDTPYIDPPNPKPEKLEHLEKTVDEENAELGIVNDMDADRVKVYFKDEWISGDDLFALFAQLVQDGSNLVASIDTSNAVEETINQKNGKIFYTKVGDPFVIDEALRVNAELAGEPNGHYCFPEFVPYNSGTLAALLVSAMELEEGLEKIPDFYTERSNLEVSDKQERMKKIESRVEKEHHIVSDMDGIKFRLGPSNVLIRPSGSSPVIRAISEAKKKRYAQESLEKAEEIIRNP